MSTTESSAAAAQSAANVAFADLGLSDKLLSAVDALGYVTPTPVQALAIPEVLAGRDILAAAQTGTGKTAAFLLPTMNNLALVEHGTSRKGVGCGPTMLVVTPTRELAQQIEDVCKTIAGITGHTSVTVVGGLSYNPQRKALHRGCDILIATPGRLIDLMNQGACLLDQVQVLVLDEADRMLDMGFLPDVRRIVDATPEDRQTLLFSATLDEAEVGAITDLVHEPARVEIAPATKTAETVDQYVLPVSMEAKNALLVQVLKKEGPQRVIVFMRTKHRADACRRRLERAGITCEAIHGDRSQNQRERALSAFREGTCDVLVATDVLSRGIDISGVRYVVNFDVPVEPEDYIHRIGRTGRAGDVGWSLTFVTEADIGEFFDIETLIGKTAMTYDATGLDLGENPPALDENRVPAKRMPGRRAKARRNRAKRAIERKYAQKEKAAKRAEARKSTNSEQAAASSKEAASGASGISGKQAKKVKPAQSEHRESQPKRAGKSAASKAPRVRKASQQAGDSAKRRPAVNPAGRDAKPAGRKAKPAGRKAHSASHVSQQPSGLAPRKRPGRKMVDPEVAKVEAELRRDAKAKKRHAQSAQSAQKGKPRRNRAQQPAEPKRRRKSEPWSGMYDSSRSSSQIRTRNRSGKGGRKYR